MRLVLPFWYRLTQVVPEKGPLNGSVCVFTSVIDFSIHSDHFTQLALMNRSCAVHVVIVVVKMSVRK